MSDPSLPAIKLAVCIAFHYVEERLVYLDTLCGNFPGLAQQIDVTVVTNTNDRGEQQRILDAGRRHGLALSLFVPSGLGHPYLLPWSHFEVMRARHADSTFTHFLYQEDDLLVRLETLHYLLGAREMLRETRLLPSILRVEKKDADGDWYATDVTAAVSLAGCSQVQDKSGVIGFLNLPGLYQGMYFLDREAMTEHLEGRSSHPDSGKWRIRERAAQGLTFSNVPEGFASRNVLPYHVASRRIDPSCFVHHLPDNYATNPRARHGKLRVDEILT